MDFLTSFAIIVLSALVLGSICKKLKLPALVGMLIVGIVFTPILGFDAVCYAGPAAWLLADIPLIIIYLVKQHRFGKAKHS